MGNLVMFGVVDWVLRGVVVVMVHLPSLHCLVHMLSALQLADGFPGFALLC